MGLGGRREQQSIVVRVTLAGRAERGRSDRSVNWRWRGSVNAR